MRSSAPTRSASVIRSTSSTIRKTSRLLRVSLLVAAVAIPAIVLGANSSSASSLGQLFTRVSTIFSRKETTTVKVAPVSPALSEEAAAPMTPSETLTVERSGHTATRLSDGRVLIAGGENSSGVLNQTEIYDAAGATFSAGGNLNDARADHSATLLGDGRVLIAGGRNGVGALSTTEIFDPSTGTFSSGPNLSVARAGHSATLFADGRILVAGGDGSGSAEIIDASLGGSAATGSMSGARSMHSASLLQDGRVLVVGGRDADGNELASGEIFDTPAVSGNYAFTYVNRTVTVNTACSAFNGFLPPIGGSVETGNGGDFANPVRAFKLNSTIPVKFNAICFGVPLTTGVHTLSATKYSNSTDSDPSIDATPTDAATTGNQFRLTDSEWHFNMNTKGLGNNGQGTWLLQATLFDGSKYTVWVGIKK